MKSAHSALYAVTFTAAFILALLTSGLAAKRSVLLTFGWASLLHVPVVVVGYWAWTKQRPGVMQVLFAAYFLLLSSFCLYAAYYLWGYIK